MEYYFRNTSKKAKAKRVSPLGFDVFAMFKRPEPESLESAVARVAEAAGATVLSLNREQRTALVDVTEAQRAEIEAKSGVELHPNYKYQLAAFLDEVGVPPIPTPLTAGAHQYLLKVQTATGVPVPGASVVVQIEAHGQQTHVFLTDADGSVEFSLDQSPLANIRVKPRCDFWCTSISDVQPGPRHVIVAPLSMPYEDSMRHFFPDRIAKAGEGVKVAVIDAGIDQHADLPQLSVRRTIVNGTVTDGCEANGIDHGTHVAGIICGQRHGIAPGVQLMGYCVFAKGEVEADSIDVVTAIDLAVEDGAEIINLSLGLPVQDTAIAHAIANAIDAGVFVVAATGNEGANKINCPACLDDVYAVGAVGVANAFAPNSTHRFFGERQRNGANEFVMEFSNYAEDEVDGAAPGLAVVSTVSLNGYQAQSGTSMAAPVIAGIAATILADNLELTHLEGRTRVEELRKLLYNASQRRNLDSKYVGAGLPIHRSHK